MKDINSKNTPFVSGIDALYYFAQSGGGYPRYYMNITDQIENKKEGFNALNYAYADNDIIITINDIDLKYSGMGRDGFLWFNHEFFRIGFKDLEKAQNIHNIRVQLNSIGIYTLGIESLVKYINTKLLKGSLLSTNYFPVTRIDVNMFIQHNFNYLKKEMILSKKKNHSANISERSTGYELETYYVGKKPFLLRIYNKLKELETASEIKRELMHNYFLVNNLDTRKPIFNVEFEYHREFLKLYDIDTVEDALSRSKSLFELGCKFIKVIDTSSLTEEQINSTNRKRADILPIWEYISTHYDNKYFMQIETPLEKIEKISYRYSLEDARKPIKRQIMRLLLHDNSPTVFYFYELLQNAKKEFALRDSYKKLQRENTQEQNSEPSITDELKNYSDEGLQNYEARLYSDLETLPIGSQLYKDISEVYEAVNAELTLRGLLDDVF
ncbi:MAG: hypothetical protein WC665_06220 [Sulfurimonas sp.]|jgi:hypothetical protein